MRLCGNSYINYIVSEMWKGAEGGTGEDSDKSSISVEELQVSFTITVRWRYELCSILTAKAEITRLSRATYRYRLNCAQWGSQQTQE